MRRAPVTVLNRSELEGLVTLGVDHLKTAEERLRRRYRHLENAGAAARRDFLRSLRMLDLRARAVERVLAALEAGALSSRAPVSRW
jgi:hypothetical protein